MDTQDLLSILRMRFEKHKTRHPNLNWEEVLKKLEASPDKLSSLQKMEETGGEPDVVDFDKKTGEYIFFDCSPESPKERRSWCYDKEALDKRKENKPKDNVMDVAKSIGIEILSEADYRFLQTLGEFDQKTSSWLQTPENIRKLGGAIFGDFRYGTVFIYHNGADSYYAARGFRGKLRI
ncbi:DUF4256 domain-containing protein [Chryseobacterium koreense]|uniref:DUF4256 domain-containing protein n=1 Tax=Chryseobacterium koreense CCUG 49689 TaxID=1304281 RepID=A0A0J7J108_9FLAO|nr:DUF4256 domain-containing protein [Chryseobacterium koreense]KMQ71957.1 hypothetical protein ACM44_04615 [Chryseobacterium koreense CCUG 49689]MBB5334115.1 hypothetical protein [Chryseobacterium koreense]